MNPSPCGGGSLQHVRKDPGLVRETPGVPNITSSRPILPLKADFLHPYQVQRSETPKKMLSGDQFSDSFMTEFLSMLLGHMPCA